jgi:hypothetical protein
MRQLRPTGKGQTRLGILNVPCRIRPFALLAEIAAETARLTGVLRVGCDRRNGERLWLLGPLGKIVVDFSAFIMYYNNNRR